jgi:hypothetical protein
LVLSDMKPAKSISVRDLTDGIYFICTNGIILKFIVKH